MRTHIESQVFAHIGYGCKYFLLVRFFSNMAKVGTNEPVNRGMLNEVVEAILNGMERMFAKCFDLITTDLIS